MHYAPRIVLRLPLAKPWALGEFAEAWIRDKVAIVAIVGPGCAEMEDVLDNLIEARSSDDGPRIVTSSHPDESFEEVLEFASTWDDPRIGVQIVSF